LTPSTKSFSVRMRLGVTELAESFGLNLADALAGDLEGLA